jgi:hypothetical protein
VNQAAEQLLLQAQFEPAAAPPAPPPFAPAPDAGWGRPSAHHSAVGLDLGELWGELPSNAPAVASRATAYDGLAGMTPDQLSAIFSTLEPELDLEFVE